MGQFTDAVRWEVIETAEIGGDDWNDPALRRAAFLLTNLMADPRLSERGADDLADRLRRIRALVRCGDREVIG